MRIFLIASCLFFSTLLFAENTEIYILSPQEKSAAAIKELGATLQQALLAAMGKGGPLEAAAVCQELAPKLTQDISEKHGVILNRTALRIRNTNNAPDAWEVAVLKKFQARLDNGEAINTLVYTENTEDGFRLMRAIPTGAPCLVCHGDSIPAALGEKIYKLYPQDQARGFKIGEIRGAFSVLVPR